MKSIFKRLLQFLEGVIVGFGAIMPGISGGTLCVAFGMYRPLLGIFSSPAENIKKTEKSFFSSYWVLFSALSAYLSLPPN